MAESTLTDSYSSLNRKYISAKCSFCKPFPSVFDNSILKLSDTDVLQTA